MIDISFEINGRKVSANRVGNNLEAAILKSFRDSITRSVGHIRCTEHGGRPKIKAKGRGVDSMSVEVTGCCDTLVNRVKKKIT